MGYVSELLQLDFVAGIFAGSGVTYTTVPLVKSPPAFWAVGFTLWHSVICMIDGPPGRQDSIPGYRDLYRSSEARKSMRLCGTNPKFSASPD